MATLREELISAGADMSSTVVVVAFDGMNPSNPIVGLNYDRDGWDGSHWNQKVDPSDPTLDMEYDGGFGGMKAPRAVAWDAAYIYVQCNLMGATSFERVSRFSGVFYLGSNEIPPVMGGE